MHCGIYTPSFNQSQIKLIHSSKYETFGMSQAFSIAIRRFLSMLYVFAFFFVLFSTYVRVYTYRVHAIESQWYGDEYLLDDDYYYSDYSCWLFGNKNRFEEKLRERKRDQVIR